MSKLLGILDPMPIGKYRGTHVGTVIEEDPSYVHWMINTTQWRLDDDAIKYLHENWKPGGDFEQ